MPIRRTPAWWSTRILLAIAIGLILVAALVAWLTPGPFVDPRPARGLGPLLIPARLVAPVVPLAIAIVGWSG
jgi:hypothetical protein